MHASRASDKTRPRKAHSAFSLLCNLCGTYLGPGLIHVAFDVDGERDGLTGDVDKASRLEGGSQLAMLPEAEGTGCHSVWDDLVVAEVRKGRAEGRGQQRKFRGMDKMRGLVLKKLPK